MAFQFVDKDVAARFETDFTGDPVVRVPNHHMGKLSRIDVKTAEALIAMKSNLVREKNPKLGATFDDSQDNIKVEKSNDKKSKSASE